MKISLNLDNFSTHLKPFTVNFSDIAHPYKLLASKYSIYHDSLLLSYFFIYLLFALAHLCMTWQIPPLVPFSTINSISLSVNNSNSTFVFFKHAFHANPGADKTGQDQVHIFQYTYF